MLNMLVFLNSCLSIFKNHVDKMLEAFRSNYGNEIETGQARQSGKRLYYVFKR